ncbi:uncharacterized protein LOC143034697 [Oratosquilla oratoria]|uniref:uncharacterized protein LOC143034697 n=1 Tax=Oratosquilla oratoria TaxID=337810 RepID=UPI003F75B41C
MGSALTKASMLPASGCELLYVAHRGLAVYILVPQRRRPAADGGHTALLGAVLPPIEYTFHFVILHQWMLYNIDNLYDILRHALTSTYFRNIKYNIGDQHSQAILFLVGLASAAPMAFPEYTPEVAAARAEFEAAYAAAVAAATVLPEASYLEYTPEVAAAREEFMVTYNAAFLAASEAEAAPAAEAEAEVPAKAVVEVELKAAEEASLEVAPEAAPVEAAVAHLVAPEPVTDTDEVALAKKEFVAAYEAAVAAIAAGALPEVVNPEGAPAPVEDTPEVADAKVKFAAAYKAAATMAELAADVDLDGSLSRLSGLLSPMLTNTLPFGAYGIHAPLLHAHAPLAYSASPLTVKGVHVPFASPYLFVEA